MRVRKIIDSLRQNVLTVVVCVALAVAFYLFFLFSTVDRKTFIVPLAIEAQNGMVAASSVPHTVKVTVLGKPESISTLHENDFSAYLDLNYVAREGETRLPALAVFPRQDCLRGIPDAHVSRDRLSRDHRPPEPHL